MENKITKTMVKVVLIYFESVLGADLAHKIHTEKGVTGKRIVHFYQHAYIRFQVNNLF